MRYSLANCRHDRDDGSGEEDIEIALPLKDSDAIGETREIGIASGNPCESAVKKDMSINLRNRLYTYDVFPFSCLQLNLNSIGFIFANIALNETLPAERLSICY